MRGPQLVQRPLLPAVTGFTLGVLAAGAGADNPARNLILMVGLALILSCAAGVLAFQRRVLSLVVLPVAFFVAGLAVSRVAAVPERRPSSLATPIDDPSVADSRDDAVVLEGFVLEAPDRGERADHLLIDWVGTATAIGSPLRPSSGRIRVRIPRDDSRGVASPSCGDAGDRVRLLAHVRDPEAQTFPGGTSAKAWAVRRGISHFGFANSAKWCIRIARAERSGLRIAMERVRARVHEGIDRHLRGPESAVVRAFATGDQSGISRAVSQDFRASGLSHLLAVSGLNLAIVSGLFVIALGFFFRFSERIMLGIGARRLAAIAGIPFVILYTLLVGASPSALRAALMVVALLFSYLVLRFREAWSSLSLALLVMLAFDPPSIRDVSLQLSFAAVAALLRIYPALLEAFGKPSALSARSRWLRWPLEVALASLAATLGTAPLVARYFEQLSIVGLLANLPAAPLSSLLLVPLSLVGGLLSTFCEPLAGPVLQLAGWASSALLLLAHWAALVPYASVRITAPTPLECMFFYGATAGFTARSKNRRWRWFGAASFAALIACVGVAEIHRSTFADLRVTFLPVGQGDAIVAELPHGHVLVVDTGPKGGGIEAAERVILPYLRHRRIRRIDTLVLTHPHADHTGGLEAIARAMEIGEVWWTGDTRESDPELIDALKNQRVRTVTATSTVEHIAGVGIEILGPVGNVKDSRSVNDGSIVLRLTFGKTRILLAGDAEASAEVAMIARCAGCLEADVLKVGHHGSRTSSADAFLDVVRPTYAIFTVGEHNHFGFPHRAVWDRFVERGVTSYRTDRNGAVTVETNGEAIAVTPYVATDGVPPLQNGERAPP